MYIISPWPAVNPEGHNKDSIPKNAVMDIRETFTRMSMVRALYKSNPVEP